MRPHSGALTVAALALASCMDPTPFGTDTQDHDLNRANSEQLLATPGSGPLRFVAIGDTHDAYDELARTVEHINSRDDVDFVVHVGDVTNLGLLKEFEWTQEALSRLTMPVFVVLGNHDAISSGKEVYRNMYGDFDFAFLYEQHKFVFFNSNSVEFSDQAPNRAWLEAQLSDLQGADSAILVTHQDLRSFVGLGAYYEALIRVHPVRLVVHGHLEDFALDEWDGVPILQCSTFQRTGIYTVVTVAADPELSFEICRLDECVPQSPGQTWEGAP